LLGGIAELIFERVRFDPPVFENYTEAEARNKSNGGPHEREWQQQPKHGGGKGVTAVMMMYG